MFNIASATRLFRDRINNYKTRIKNTLDMKPILKNKMKIQIQGLKIPYTIDTVHTHTHNTQEQTFIRSG